MVKVRVAKRLLGVVSVWNGLIIDGDHGEVRGRYLTFAGAFSSLVNEVRLARRSVLVFGGPMAEALEKFAKAGG